MALEIIPGRYFIGFFYLDFPARTPQMGRIGPFGKGGNLQALVWKEGEEAPGDGPHEWHMRYRFRYYRDQRMHEHNDEMHWFEATMPISTEEEARDTAEQFITMSGAAINQKPHIWLIEGNIDRFIERVKQDPPYWMHVEPNLTPDPDAHPEEAEFNKAFEPLTRLNRARPKILDGPIG